VGSRPRILLYSQLMRSPAFFRTLFVLGLVLALALSACRRGGRDAVLEVAYVMEPKVTLRDRVATVYSQVGEVSNGDRVEILEHDPRRRFVRVRTGSGLEGWVQQRFLAGEEVYHSFEALALRHKDAPLQARGVTRNALNMYLEPSRDAERLYRIAEDQPVEVLLRAATGREVSQPSPGGGVATRTVTEDWRLVRDAQGHVGWVLSRLIHLDAPIEVAQYSEGQRIVAYFVLNEVEHEGRKVPQYLFVYGEPRDGAEHDFNQVRVFTWNRARSRYETAYRERRLAGALPVLVGREEFGREGEVPVFTITVRDPEGNPVERRYRLSGNMVRRAAEPPARESATL
jgi:SH3-like domain-containing protein